MNVVTPKIFKINFAYFFSLIVWVTLGVYIVWRGVCLSITNDEAFSYHNVVTHNLRMMLGTANTHWFNSICLFIETHLLGDQEWKLRMHSYISFAAFCWGLFTLTTSFCKNYWQNLIGLALMGLNIYLIDFFSLARGYGMSLAFEMIALSMIANSQQHEKFSFRVYACLACATMSNYTSIFVLAAVFLYDLIDQFSKHRFAFLREKRFYTRTSPFLLTCLIAVPNIFFVKIKGDLEEGQNNGLLQDSIGVFLERSFPGFHQPAVVYTVAGIIIFSIFLFYWYHNIGLAIGIRKIFVLFLIIVIMIEALHVLLNIPYVFGRTALFFTLIVQILVFYIVVHFLDRFSQTVQIMVVCSIVGLSLYHFIAYKNHSTTIEWWKSEGIENCLYDLKNIEGEKIKGKKMGMHLAQLGAYTNYYRLKINTGLNDTVYSFCENADGIYDSLTLATLMRQDYLLMLKPYDQYFPSEKIEVIRQYKEMNADLLKVKH